MNCPHTNLTFIPDVSGQKRNVYRCACGTIGYRLWSRTKGLTPFQPYVDDAAKLLSAWRHHEIMEEERRRDEMRRRDFRENPPDWAL